MRTLSNLLLAAITVTTTACVAMGDDIKSSDESKRAQVHSLDASIDANDVIQIRARNPESGMAAVDGVVLAADGRVVGELMPGGFVGELAGEVAISDLPEADLPDVESISLTVELTVELYTAEGELSHYLLAVDARRHALHRRGH